MARIVEITTPSRLHFGMFSFGRADVRQFGGVGVMVDRPGLHVQIRPAAQFLATGPLAERAIAVTDRLATQWHLDELPACQIEVLNSAPEHAGLGTGTQFELAVTAGLNAFRGGRPLGAEQLARLSGRGARSAIGTHGFLHGGLLVESGKLPNDVLSPLERRIELPDTWRFVLITLPGSGLAGDAERRAFGGLPPVATEITAKLRAEVADELLPAAANSQFERFAESLYRFNREAGMCFASSQGGPYANPKIAQLVENLRASDARGVGQSSWGPTVFAIAEDEPAARQLARHITRAAAPQASCLIVRPVNNGAQINTTVL